MSVWPEEQTLEEFISNSDMGKDMYIAGIPRGVVFKTVSGSSGVILSISGGSGCLINASLSGKNGLDPMQTSGKTMKIVVDGVKTFLFNCNLTAQDWNSQTAGIEVDATSSGSSVNVNSDLNITNAVVKPNVSIRFKESIEVSLINGYGPTGISGSATYALDSWMNGGSD